MIHLRPFQENMRWAIYESWRVGNKIVMAVLPTGAGKTVLFCMIAAEQNCAVAVIAHRQELISQISLALARNGVRHRVIGSRALQKACASLHTQVLGRNFVDPSSRVAACGVDTLIRHKEENAAWAAQVGLFIGDEGHHFLVGNKWGEAVTMFPNAYGLLVTATPTRADGKGLGRHADGLVDALIVGPSMRNLIDEGYLTGYRLIAPKSSINYDTVPTSEATGDFNQVRLREAVHADDRRIGDIVGKYKEYAAGKLGITFAVDVEDATDIARSYREAGVPAEVVSAKTPDALRFNILERFRAGQVHQLVNVDLFGEGFDVPACDVVSFARPTQSFALYAQQFGRPLRLATDKYLLDRWDEFTDAQRLRYIAISNKPKAIIIDHVSNIVRHNGPPDMPRTWTLDRRERVSRGAPDDVIPHRNCDECAYPYPRYLRACPGCGNIPVPAGRVAPEQVDGDMLELSDEWLAAWRAERERIDGTPNISPYVDGAVAGGMRKQHEARKDAQRSLRDVIALWAGHHHYTHARADSEIYRRFFLRYHTDIGSAQTLGKPEAEALYSRITTELQSLGVLPNGQP